MQGGWVYILTNRPNGTLYVGVTSDLPTRIHQHREGLVDGFTKRYGLKLLVYAEQHERIESADPARNDDQALASGVEGALDRR